MHVHPDGSVADGLKRFARGVYYPVLDAALRWRYLTAAVGVGVMIVTVGPVLSGRPGFRFVPALETERPAHHASRRHGVVARGRGHDRARRAGAA